MNELKARIVGDQAAFRPGDTLRATVAWNFDQSPKSIRANLLWTTAGSGDTDTSVVRTLDYPGEPLTAGTWDLELPIPAEGPPSYEGHVLSVRWVLEVLVDGRKAFDDVDLVVSPTVQVLKPPA